MDNNIKEFISELDTLWGRLFTYNHALMKRSEDENKFGSESFTDVIDFYLTSQAQCFIKDVMLHHFGSSGLLLAARCFIEGLALKRMYEKGKIDNIQVELLRHQVHIIEYNYYKEFDDIADKILLPEKLEKDYDDSVKFFQEKLAGTYSEKQISAILKTNKPFLCEPYTNFRKIVGENLGDDYAKLYGLYSQAVHPSVNDFYMNEGIWDTLTGVLFLVMEEYNSLPQSKLTFNSYYTSIYTSDIARNYEDIVRQECTILVDIGDVFCKSFNKNYTSDTLASMSLLMGEMCTDKLLGLCEQVKSKWKIVLELCASFYECYITPSLHEERFMLLEEHEHLQTQRNLGESCSVNQAYSIYKTLYPNGVNIDLFEKNFLTTCGYTIDEKGVAKSLTGIVKEFIKKFTTAKAPISLDRAMLLDYIESQMISHANGYMWYANSGSWGDVNNVIIGADICVIFLLESILTVFKIHRAIDESNQYKQIINIVRNSIKRIRALSEEKAKILKIPGIII